MVQRLSGGVRRLSFPSQNEKQKEEEEEDNVPLDNKEEERGAPTDNLQEDNLLFTSLEQYRLSPRQSSSQVHLSHDDNNNNNSIYSPSSVSVDHLGISNSNAIGYRDRDRNRDLSSQSYSSSRTATTLSNETHSSHGRSPLDRAMTIYTTAISRPSTRKTTTILNIPHRLLKWVYSISLFIVIILMLAFIAVTPLDVIVQTFNSSNSTAVKTFIVIAVCVAFLIISIIIYLARVYKFKVTMNDVPQKSLYIPFENDFPKSVFKYIDLKLKYSHDVSILAGPLRQNYIINHPGLSPPEYVQKRNVDNNGGMSGRLLPPNMQYDDVLQSFADKFYIGKILTDEDLPTHFSIRDIFLYLSERLIEPRRRMGNGILSKNEPDVEKLIAIYEKCRFGSKLIEEMDLFQLMIEFDKFGLLCHNDYRSTMPKKRRFSRIFQSSGNDYNINEDGYISTSDLKYYSSPMFYDSEEEDQSEEEDEKYNSNYRDENEDEERFDSEMSTTESEELGTNQVEPLVSKSENELDHKQEGDRYYSDIERSSLPDADRRSSLRLRKQTSISSSKSVIRNKLALQSRHTLSSLRYDDGDDDNNSLVRNRSGYITDLENDEFEAEESKRFNFSSDKRRKHQRELFNSENKEIQIVINDGMEDLNKREKSDGEEEKEEDDDDDDMNFYQFRRRRNNSSLQENPGQPITPNQSNEEQSPTVTDTNDTIDTIERSEIVEQH